MRLGVLFLLLFALISCKRSWTEKDKNEFYSGCMSNAAINKDITNPKAYCGCLLQKIITKYPNANDAPYIKYDTTAKQLAKDCLKNQ